MVLLPAPGGGEPSGDLEEGDDTGCARDWIAVPVWERRRAMSCTKVSWVLCEMGGGGEMYGVDVG